MTQGSQTILETQPGTNAPSATLRLRAEPSESRHIQWAEDVIDNEGMGKKSSKVCCIYHKTTEPGDSESDSSSSSDSDSDSEPDLSRAQRAGGRGRGKRNGGDKDKARKPSPNAYERQPKNKSKSVG
jgi:protein phosphatase 1 regulatory subunit 11